MFFFSEFKIKLIFIIESKFKRAMDIFTFFPPKSKKCKMCPPPSSVKSFPWTFFEMFVTIKSIKEFWVNKAAETVNLICKISPYLFNLMSENQNLK